MKIFETEREVQKLVYENGKVEKSKGELSKLHYVNKDTQSSLVMVKNGVGSYKWIVTKINQKMGNIKAKVECDDRNNDVWQRVEMQKTKWEVSTEKTTKLREKKQQSIIKLVHNVINGTPLEY